MVTRDQCQCYHVHSIPHAHWTETRPRPSCSLWWMMWIFRANTCFWISVPFWGVRQVRGVSKYLYFQFNACVSVWEWRVHVSELPWSVDTGYIYISTYLHIYNIHPVSSHPSGHQLGSPCYHSLVASSRVTGWVEYPIPGTMGTSSPALLYMIMEILFGNKGKFSRPSMIYNMEVTKTKMNICCSKTRILFIKKHFIPQIILTQIHWVPFLWSHSCWLACLQKYCHFSFDDKALDFKSKNINTLILMTVIMTNQQKWQSLSMSEHWQIGNLYHLLFLAVSTVPASPSTDHMVQDDPLELV